MTQIYLYQVVVSLLTVLFLSCSQGDQVEQPFGVEEYGETSVSYSYCCDLDCYSVPYTMFKGVEMSYLCTVEGDRYMTWLVLLLLSG